jgi:chromosome segregation ATPase
MMQNAEQEKSILNNIIMEKEREAAKIKSLMSKNQSFSDIELLRVENEEGQTKLQLKDNQIAILVDEVTKKESLLSELVRKSNIEKVELQNSIANMDIELKQLRDEFNHEHDKMEELIQQFEKERDELENDLRLNQATISERSEMFAQETRYSLDLAEKANIEKMALKVKLAALQEEIVLTKNNSETLKHLLSQKEKSVVDLKNQLIKKESFVAEMVEKANMEKEHFSYRSETEKAELQDIINSKEEEILELKQLFNIRERNDIEAMKIADMEKEDLENKILELELQLSDKGPQKRYADDLNSNLRKMMKIDEAIKEAMKQTKLRNEVEPQILTPKILASELL